VDNELHQWMNHLEPIWVGLILFAWNLGVCSYQGLIIDSSCCQFQWTNLVS